LPAAIVSYRVDHDGRLNGKARNIKIAIRILKEQFGSIEARLSGA